MAGSGRTLSAELLSIANLRIGDARQRMDSTQNLSVLMPLK
jgi:hypothetical protein